MEQTGRILLFAKGASYLVSTLKQAIEAGGNKVLQVDSSAEAIPQVGDDIVAILMYLDRDLVERADILVYVKDLSSEKRLPVFLIGIPEEIGTVCNVIPNWLVKERFVRPVDCIEVAKTINDFVKIQIKKINELKKILAVDDSGVYLREINTWLKDKYQVSLANSGIAAMKHLGSDKPDLILLDYEMPICNGKQILEMIRDDADCASIPVIFLTGNGNKDTIVELMAHNVSGYLLKSLPAEEIVKYVDDFFERKKEEEDNMARASHVNV